MTPFWTNLPTQSCGPTIRSGPLPVGTWVMKSSRTAAKSLTTSFTSIPVSALNFAVMSFRAGERSASTHMVMVLAPEALRSGLAVAVAGAVAAAPPQALSASAADYGDCAGREYAAAGPGCEGVLHLHWCPFHKSCIHAEGYRPSSGEDSGSLVASSVMWLTAASASKVHAEHDFGKSPYRRVLIAGELSARERCTGDEPTVQRAGGMERGRVPMRPERWFRGDFRWKRFHFPRFGLTITGMSVDSALIAPAAAGRRR